MKWALNFQWLRNLQPYYVDTVSLPAKKFKQCSKLVKLQNQVKPCQDARHVIKQKLYILQIRRIKAIYYKDEINTQSKQFFSFFYFKFNTQVIEIQKTTNWMRTIIDYMDLQVIANNKSSQPESIAFFLISLQMQTTAVCIIHVFCGDIHFAPKRKSHLTVHAHITYSF